MFNLLTTCIFQRHLIVTQLQQTIWAKQQHINQLVEELRTFQGGEGSLDGCQSYYFDNLNDSYMESTTQGNLEHTTEPDHEQLDWSQRNAAVVFPSVSFSPRHLHLSLLTVVFDSFSEHESDSELPSTGSCRCFVTPLWICRHFPPHPRSIHIRCRH